MATVVAVTVSLQKIFSRPHAFFLSLVHIRTHTHTFYNIPHFPTEKQLKHLPNLLKFLLLSVLPSTFFFIDFKMMILLSWTFPKGFLPYARRRKKKTRWLLCFCFAWFLEPVLCCEVCYFFALSSTFEKKVVKLIIKQLFRLNSMCAQCSRDRSASN